MEVDTTMTMAIFYFELLGLHMVYAIACFDIKGNGLIRIPMYAPLAKRKVCRF